MNFGGQHSAKPGANCTEMAVEIAGYRVPAKHQAMRQGSLDLSPLPYSG